MTSQVLTWGSLIGSLAAFGLSGLSLGYGLATRRTAIARARRRAATVAREAVFQYWRSTDREMSDLSRRIERLEAAEHARHAGRPPLAIARTGEDAA